MFVKKIKKVNLIKGLLLLFASIFFIGCIFLDKEVANELFKEPCAITDIDSYLKCVDDGREYVKITTDVAYPTAYYYQENGIEVGKFVDIDVDEKSLIAVVSNKTEEEIFEKINQGQTITIEGHLEKFDGVYKEGLLGVKNDYINEFIEEYPEMTEQEVLDMFLPYGLDEYNGSKVILYLTTATFVGLILLCLAFAIKDFYIVLNPRKYKNFKKIEDFDYFMEKAENEYNKGDFFYDSKHLKIGDKYLYHMTLTSLFIEKIDNINWVYEKVIRQYGVFEVNRMLIISNKQGLQVNVSIKKDEIEAVMAYLKDKNPSIVLGFTTDLQRMYKKDPSSVKE